MLFALCISIAFPVTFPESVMPRFRAAAVTMSESIEPPTGTDAQRDVRTTGGMGPIDLAAAMVFIAMVFIAMITVMIDQIGAAVALAFIATAVIRQRRQCRQARAGHCNHERQFDVLHTVLLLDWTVQELLYSGVDEFGLNGEGDSSGYRRIRSVRISKGFMLILIWCPLRLTFLIACSIRSTSSHSENGRKKLRVAVQSVPYAS